MTGTAKKRIHIAGGFLLLVVALVLLFFWNIYSGSVSVEPKDVLRLLFQGAVGGDLDAGVVAR